MTEARQREATMPSGQKTSSGHKRTHPARFKERPFRICCPAVVIRQPRPQYAPRACDARAHGELFRRHSNYQRGQTLSERFDECVSDKTTRQAPSGSEFFPGTPSSSAPSIISTTVRFAEDRSTRTADDGKIRKGRSSVCIVLRQWKRCRQCHCRQMHNLRIPKQSHDLSRCTAFPSFT